MKKKHRKKTKAEKKKSDKSYSERVRVVYVIEVTKIILNLFILLCFFFTKRFHAYKNTQTKNQLIKQKEASKNNKGDNFLRSAHKLLRG